MNPEAGSTRSTRSGLFAQPLWMTVRHTIAGIDRWLIPCIVHVMNNRADLELPTDSDAIGAGQGGMLGLLGVAHALQGRLEAALESIGLSSPKYLVLQRLLEAGGPVSLSCLADRQKCVRSNITQLVDRLEADGLVERVGDPADRRAVRAAVTPLGVERFKAATTAIDQVQEQLASRLDPQDRESFLRVLSVIRNP